MKGCLVTSETQSRGQILSENLVFSTFVVLFCLFWVVCSSCCLRNVFLNQPHNPSRPVLLEGYQPIHTNSNKKHAHIWISFGKLPTNHSNHSIDLRLKPATLQGFERKGFLPRREVPEASPFSADGRWDEVKHLGYRERALCIQKVIRIHKVCIISYQ